MNQDTNQDKRHFTRIPFTATATVINSYTGHKYMAELLDISLKGALISKPDDWQGINGEHYTLHLQLGGEEAEINLAVIVVHTEETHVGFKTEHMDIESATHLHRLVELNLGDEKLLERELGELVHAG